MKVHHLNCGCMCPVGGAFFDGFSPGLTVALSIIDVIDVSSGEKVKHWKFYEAGGEDWFGFEAVRGLEGLPPEILLIPLAGHTQGHAGVAIHTAQEWLLHAGDAYFYRHEMDVDNRHCTPGLQFYQWMMEVDRKTRLFNQDRLYDLSCDRDKDVRLFCSHDAIEFNAFAAHATKPSEIK